jgi:hypothetical protein
VGGLSALSESSRLRCSLSVGVQLCPVVIAFFVAEELVRTEEFDWKLHLCLALMAS